MTYKGNKGRHDMSVSTAVILAAGEGSRMRPLTYARPKVMLPLTGRPILENLLVELIEAGIKQFIFVVGYHEEEIRNYFGSGERWHVAITYVKQTEQAGTGDALRAAAGLVTGNFLAVNGDVIISASHIGQLAGKPDTAMMVFRAKEVTGLGVVETDGNRIVRIHEKSANPPSNLANAGLYLFTPAVFEAITKTEKSPRGEYEITDTIQLIINSGRPVYYHEIDNWFDLSYPWDLLSANEIKMQQLVTSIKGEIEDNVTIKGVVVVGEKTVVRAGSYIVGPVMIGSECDIGPNCFIRSGTVVGDHCHIGAGVEVKNSIIMTGTKVPHLSYVGDSIIGRNCNLGAGTKIANLKLDKTGVVVNNIKTGRRKLGAIIGDNVQTGINASINAGCMIGDSAFIGPGVLAHGVIAPGHKVF